MTARRGALLAIAALAAACARAPRHRPHLLPVVESPIALPPGFAAPPAPRDNPLTLAKAELGRYLFYDRRLSYNRTESCASCHQQRFGFCDGRAHAVGSTGEEHHLNTMSLANVGYRRPLTWTNPDITTLEQQVLVPLTHHDPIELGMDGHFDELLARLRGDERYVRLFAAAFPAERDPITIDNLARAIASFERTLISAGSPYDRLLLYGDSNALSDEAWRGRRLFFAKCAGCHGGNDFSMPAGGDAYQGGKVRVPTLLNVAVTAPYMHDGHVATLDEAVGHTGAKITGQQKQELAAFLRTLTDERFLRDPRFSDPW